VQQCCIADNPYSSAELQKPYFAVQQYSPYSRTAAAILA
jgi:hypothetical protein